MLPDCLDAQTGYQTAWMHRLVIRLPGCTDCFSDCMAAHIKLGVRCSYSTVQNALSDLRYPLAARGVSMNFVKLF